MFGNELFNNLKWLGWALHGVGAAGIALGGWLFATQFYVGLDNHRADCEMQSARLRRLLEDSGQIRAENSRLTAALKQLQDQRAALQRRVPDEPREAEFLEQITEAAHGSGLHIRDYRPGAVSPMGSYSRMEIGMTCAGSYGGLCKFLEMLSTLPRLANITRLDVIATSPDEMYTVNMTLMIYFGVGKPAELAQGGPDA